MFPPRIINSLACFAMLFGAASALSAQGSLPPVRLIPQEAPTPQAGVPQEQATPGGYAQPSPQTGTYPQPSSATYPQPGTSVVASTPSVPAQYAQPRPGEYPQPSAGGAAAAQGSGVVLSQPSAHRISLVHGPVPEDVVPSTQPLTSARTPLPDPANKRSSLPPPRLFGKGESEGASAAPMAPGKVSVAATRAKPSAKLRPAPPKAPQPAVIPGKPLLDEFGVQRMDPDGKPMFSAPTLQARDRHGKLMFADGKPVFQTAENPGYDEHGRRVKIAKEEAPKVVRVTMEHGAFTVDGIVGKVQLNYDIGEMHFLYLYVPDTGVTIVSPNPFPGATRQRGAFRGNMLIVKTEEHALAVSSTEPFFGKRPVDAYVMVDRGFLMPGAKFPVFGYGSTARAPYVWPGSKSEEKLAGVSDDAPPVPQSLKPKLVGDCPAGQRCVDPGTAEPLPIAAPAKDAAPSASKAPVVTTEASVAPAASSNANSAP